MSNISLKAILITIGVGIWVMVLQNAGVIPTRQNVYVKGGYLDIENVVRVNGSVDIDNEVKIRGSIDNTVDVDIVKINGWEAANYYEYKINGKEFHSLGTR